MSEKIRLRPVVYTTDKYNVGAKDTTKQIFLLKALKITNDPKKIRDLIGVKTVAEVYRTLDKLAMRKEYHNALAKNGIDFDFIINGLKEEAENAPKSADKIKAYSIFLKSLGLDKYDNDTQSGGTWEEELIKAIDKKKEEVPSLTEKVIDVEYEVNVPDVPEHLKAQREEDEKIYKGIYE